MNTYKASNIALSEFRKFLESEGFKHIRTNGGHYIYCRSDLNRPIPLQSHIDPVPEFIVLEILNHMDMSTKTMLEKMGKSKGTTERKVKVARKGKRSKKKS